MPRIPVHTVADAPEAARDELKALEAKFGKVLNIHGEMAHSPLVLQAYVALQQVIEDYGTFDARTRESIALVVGNVDKCAYCQSAHTMGAKAAGLTTDQTVAVREGRVDFDPKLAALLTLVRESAGALGHVCHLAGRARRGLDRHRAHRGLAAHQPEPVHQPLQPPRADRPRHPRRARTLTGRPCRGS
jgi:AhpD family alkylhydroperoxidase